MEVLRPRRGVSVLALGGEHDLDSAAALEQLVAEVLDGADHVVIDLSAVQFLDSSTIAVLVRARRRADEQGARFGVVIGTSSLVLRGLEVSGVLPTLNGVSTLDEALLAAPSD
jgi:stage II sporulation protein AA (anti-sigma F factor antagonist)